MDPPERFGDFPRLFGEFPRRTDAPSLGGGGREGADSAVEPFVESLTCAKGDEARCKAT